MYGSAKVCFCGAMIFGTLTIAGCAKRKHAAAHPAPATLPVRSSTPRSAPALTPADHVGPEFGLASWYGYPYHGRAAANGEIYDMEKLTAAHRTLPFNTWVRVTNLTNGKAVEVRIIDRGPFIEGRSIDLSHAGARAIDLIGPGIAQVRIDVIAPPLSVPPPAALSATVAAAAPVPAPAVTRAPVPAPGPVVSSNLYAVQVGTFPNREGAEQYRITLERQYGIARIVFHDGKPPVWRVLVGSEPTVDRANLLAQRLETETGSGFVVRLDEVMPGTASVTPSSTLQR